MRRSSKGLTGFIFTPYVKGLVIDMKNKIAVKLSLYFAAALLIFSVVIGSIFLALFRNHTIELHKADMENRAVKISQTLSSFMSSNTSRGMGMGYGAYIKFLNDIAMADVWIVDENLNLITNNMGMHNSYTYADLPSNAESIVKQVFNGKTTFSESFSSLMDTPTLTIGTPVKSSDGTVIAVVLLHSPVNGINEAVNQGITTLILSICIALAIAFILAVGFSISFTKPLNKMKDITLKLAHGNYAAKTQVKRNDEIGELAANIDILSERLYEASKQSERLEQMRRDFVANVSHELRTPVTVIRGSLEALNDGVVSEQSKVAEYYKQMLGEVKGLQRLIGDLLDLSRLQNVDFAMEMTETSLCDILNDVLRSAKRIAEPKKVEFIINQQSASCRIIGDYGRLKQMFMTIIDNAVKFSPENGKVYIKQWQDEQLHVSVRDEGTGVKKEELPYIFDRFYKTKATENKSGTGLGLAIAKQIADRHNVKIDVKSDENSGCEFIFTFKK